MTLTVYHLEARLHHPVSGYRRCRVSPETNIFSHILIMVRLWSIWHCCAERVKKRSFGVGISRLIFFGMCWVVSLKVNVFALQALWPRSFGVSQSFGERMTREEADVRIVAAVRTTGTMIYDAFFVFMLFPRENNCCQCSASKGTCVQREIDTQARVLGETVLATN